MLLYAQESLSGAHWPTGHVFQYNVHHEQSAESTSLETVVITINQLCGD